MIRLIIFFAILFAVALGASWIADRPGTLVIDWQGYQLQTSVMVALVALAALVIVGIIAWSLLRGAVGSPGALRRFFSRRKREKGTAALKQGFIAIGAGNLREAQRYSRDAGRLLKNDPAVALLTAQSAQLAGDRETARKTFEAMLDDDETRLLGLHGLYVEAKREGQGEAARHYVDEAAAMAPSVPWAGKAQLEFRSADGDWEGALKALEANVANKLVDKKASRRLRAVLLTARGLELENGEPDRARKMAVEAHGLAPELVPAATLAGRLLSRTGDYRKGAKILEAAWKKEPHPEIAEGYLYLRPGDSAQDRMKRARALNDLRPNNPEGALALARVAIDLHDYAAAREALARVLRSAPSERACLMMAEVEEGEHGDHGRTREWLSRAVKMPRDPAWIADGFVSEHWAPVSPVTGRLDAFEWKVPVAMLGGAKGPVIEEELLAPMPIPAPAVVAEPAPVAEAVETVVVEPEPAKAEPAREAAKPEPAVEKAAASTPEEKEAAAGKTAPKAASEKPAEAKPALEIIEPEPAAAKAAPKPVAASAPEAAKPETDEKDLSGLPFGGRAPDDPGPAGDEDVVRREAPRYR